MIAVFFTVATLLAPHVDARIGGFSQPCGITSSPTALYADSYATGVLARVDPQTNAVVAQRKVATAPCGLAYGAGSVWVEDYKANSIVRVQPQTLKVQKRIVVGRLPWDVTERWMTTRVAAACFRLLCSASATMR